MHEDKKLYFTPLMQAGYLEQNKDQWSICPAKNIDGVTFCRISIDQIPHGLKAWKDTRNAYAIWIEPGSYSYQPVRGGHIHIRFSQVLRASSQQDTGLQSAVLSYSGKMNKKRHEMVIFAKDNAAEPIPIDQEMLISYKEQISKEQKQILGDTGALVSDQPVFYLIEDGKLVFFGHTLLFRIPYRASPRDFVPAALRCPAITDLAEAMFGYVPDTRHGDKRQAYAGRVFVDDAPLLRGGEPLHTSSEGYITPRILGSPKPTTFQHYLVQEHEERKELRHYASTPEKETVIRGHKLYWHQEQARTNPDGHIQLWLERIQEDKDVGQSTQHTGMQPLAPGAAFQVCIRFENLSDVELGALLWLVRLAGQDDCRLKLGMGKPLGMGSVALHEPQVVCSNRQQRYATLFDTAGGWATGEAAMPDEQQQQCIAAFQTYVLTHSGVQAPSFEELPRIKMLRTLLSWPGPGCDKDYTPPQDPTRYMEIERDMNRGYISGKPRNDGKVNEYANRPVLPTPLQVVNTGGDDEKHTSTAPLKKADVRLPQIGDRLRGAIIFLAKKGHVEIRLPDTFEAEDGATVRIPERLRSKTKVFVFPEAKTGGGWKVGNSRKVRVIGIREDEDGYIILQVEPIT